jgi:hypothetical protein
MAINGSRSDFTSAKNYTLDTFKEMFELSTNDVANVQRWKELKAKTNKTTDEQSEFLTLTTQLASKIITSEDWNLLLDAMYNLQKAYVDKGLNQIETTVEDYVEDYAKGDINTKLGTQINELLLTNATQVIISTSQPTVVNGALWIKPKTTT